MTAGEFYKWLNVFGVIINASPFALKGGWDASTNTPTLTSGVGDSGDTYIVIVGGNTNLDGISTWNIGDLAVFTGTAWIKVPNSSSSALQKLNNLSDLTNVEVAIANLKQGGSPLVVTGQTSDILLSNPSPTYISAEFSTAGHKITLASSNLLQSLSPSGISSISIFNSSASVAFDVYAGDGTTNLTTIPPKGEYIFRFLNNTSYNGGVIFYKNIRSVNGDSGDFTITPESIGAIGGTIMPTQVAYGVGTNVVAGDNDFIFDPILSKLTLQGDMEVVNGIYSGANTLFNSIYVSTSGDDSNNGSQQAPYKTLGAALTFLQSIIGSISATNQYTINLEAGNYTTGSIQIIPFVNIIGPTANLTVTTTISLHPNWGTSYGGSKVTFCLDLLSLNVIGSCDLDFSTYGAGHSQPVALYLSNYVYVNYLVPFNIIGYSDHNTIEVYIRNTDPARTATEFSYDINIKNAKYAVIKGTTYGVFSSTFENTHASEEFFIRSEGCISYSTVNFTSTGAGLLRVHLMSSPNLGPTNVNGTSTNLRIYYDASSYTNIITTGNPTQGIYSRSNGIYTSYTTPVNFTNTTQAVTGALIGIDNALGTIKSGGITLTNTRIPFGSGTNTITSSANFVFVNATNVLSTTGGIGLNTTTLDSSSKFDVSSTTQGTRPFPLMTTVQRDAISSPATGLMIYNTTTNQLNIYNSSAWVVV